MLNDVSDNLIQDHLWGQPLWFDVNGQSIAGILHSPNVHSRYGVVICSPIGYEFWCSYQSLHTLAVDLAGIGCHVLRFDYYGTGDSDGSYQDSDILAKWDACLESASNVLKNMGVSELCFVGLRFGATLAMRNSEKCGVSNLILWDPVISGRRFVKELKLFSISSPSNDEGSEELQVAGSIYSQETIKQISEIDLLKLSHTHIKQLSLIDRDDRPASEKYFDTLSTFNVNRTLMQGTAGMLDVPTEFGVVPKNIIGEICNIVNQSFLANKINTLPVPSNDSKLLASKKSTIHWENQSIEEEFVSIGSNRLFGIIGQPTTNPSLDKIVIFLNSGTEHHLGPGRVWVEYSRSLNVAGFSTMRADFNGIGESRIRGDDRRMQPYDESQNQDILDYIAFCQKRGYKKIALVGLCASSWIALFFAETTKVDGIIAINPQIYYKRGEPMPVVVADFRKDTDIEKVEAFWNKFHLWTLLEIMGIRPKSSRLLIKLSQLKTKTLLIFGENDPGVVYLRTRIGYRIKQLSKTGFFSLLEVAGMDHPMHRHTKRPIVKQEMIEFVKNL